MKPYQIAQKAQMNQKNKFADIFKNYPDIQAVYMFGSSVSGKEHNESDIDLAIVPRNEKVRERKLSILSDLARNGLDNVDIVFLDTDDVVTKYEAVRQNRIIYLTPDFDRGTMYSKTVRQYLDFEPYLKVQRRALKRRILNGEA
jgi:hypothetical protein